MLDAPPNITFPLVVTGEIDDSPLDGAITLDEKGDYWFESETSWSGGTQPGSSAAQLKEFRGFYGSSPIYLKGPDFWKGGRQYIRVQDLRVGTSHPDESYVEVRCTYQYAKQLSSWYHRDGAQRSPRTPLKLPALESAPEMSLIFEGDSVQLTVETPAPIEHFEIQLEAFRRLLTFAAQRPVAQLSMTGRTESGAESSIFARQFMKPGNAPKRDYRDFPLRLGNENTQNAITKWWEMSDKLRPLPQTVAGIIAQPGYVESDFVFLATVLDRLGDEWADVPNLLTKEQFQAVQGALSELELPDSFQITNTVPFEPRVVAVSELLPSEVWETLRIDRGSWIKSLKRHRNLVAHSSEQRAAHRAFMTGLGLRALRDATAVIVTLLMVQHLGVEGEALEFAADRLRVTRIHRYTNEELRFTNSGLG